MDEKDKKSAPAGAGAEGGDAVKKGLKLPTGKILFFGIIAGAIVVNIIIAFVMIHVTKPKDPTEKTAEVAADSSKAKSGPETGGEVGGVTGPVDAIVNIAGTNGERFLKVTIKFEFDEKRFPKMEEEMKKFGPKIKDMLIELLSPMTLTELNEPETRSKIRQGMLRSVNNTMPTELCQMRDVFIDQFIIQ